MHGATIRFKEDGDLMAAASFVTVQMHADF